MRGLRENAAAAAEKPKEEAVAVRVTEAKRNPVLLYTEKLSGVDEGAWKDQLDSMGNGPDIPRLFRTPGKVGVHSAHHRF